MPSRPAYNELPPPPKGCCESTPLQGVNEPRSNSLSPCSPAWEDASVLRMTFYWWTVSFRTADGRSQSLSQDFSRMRVAGISKTTCTGALGRLNCWRRVEGRHWIPDFQGLVIEVSTSLRPGRLCWFPHTHLCSEHWLSFPQTLFPAGASPSPVQSACYRR